MLESGLLIKRFGEVKAPFCAQMIDLTLNKLRGSDAVSKVPVNTIGVKILDSMAPMAFSFADGEILMSTGLLVGLENEDEVAFVLAHELGHQVLGHFQKDTINHGERSIGQKELDADKFAFGLLDQVAYQARLGMLAIKNYPDWEGVGALNLGYPTAHDRFKALITREEYGYLRPPLGTRALTQCRAQLGTVNH